MWLAVIVNYDNEVVEWEDKLILGLYSTDEQAVEVLLEYYRKEAIRIKPEVELARQRHPGVNFFDAENIVAEPGGNGVVDVGSYHGNVEFHTLAKAIFLNPDNLMEMAI